MKKNTLKKENDYELIRKKAKSCIVIFKNVRKLLISPTSEKIKISLHTYICLCNEKCDMQNVEGAQTHYSNYKALCIVIFLPTPRHQPNPTLLRRQLCQFMPLLCWCFGVGKKNTCHFFEKMVSIFFQEDKGNQCFWHLLRKSQFMFKFP